MCTQAVIWTVPPLEPMATIGEMGWHAAKETLDLSPSRIWMLHFPDFNGLVVASGNMSRRPLGTNGTRREWVFLREGRVDRRSQAKLAPARIRVLQVKSATQYSAERNSDCRQGI